MVRRPRPGGPGAARNTGLALVATPVVAFVDSDCEATPGWLDPLLAHFADPTRRRGRAQDPRPGRPRPRRVRPLRVGALAPRPRPPARSDPARHQGVVRPGRGSRGAHRRRPGRRRLRRVDPHRRGRRLRVAAAARPGWRLRYEPAAVVRHHHRVAPGRGFARRVVYGESAAPLDRRHPGSVPPLAVSALEPGRLGAGGRGRAGTRSRRGRRQRRPCSPSDWTSSRIPVGAGAEDRRPRQPVRRPAHRQRHGPPVVAGDAGRGGRQSAGPPGRGGRRLGPGAAGLAPRPPAARPGPLRRSPPARRRGLRPRRVAGCDPTSGRSDRCARDSPRCCAAAESWLVSRDCDRRPRSR